MRESHIITIAGAGSARVPALVGTLVNYKERFPLSKIIFYDIDNERMGLMEDYDRLVLKCFYPECEVVFTTDEDEAYRETDFVFCQMRVGKTACGLWTRRFRCAMGWWARRPAGRADLPTECARWEP